MFIYLLNWYDRLLLFLVINNFFILKQKTIISPENKNTNTNESLTQTHFGALDVSIAVLRDNFCRIPIPRSPSRQWHLRIEEMQVIWRIYEVNWIKTDRMGIIKVKIDWTHWVRQVDWKVPITDKSVEDKWKGVRKYSVKWRY